MKKEEKNISVIWKARHLVWSGVLIIFLVFGLGVWWAYSFEISGALVTQGELRTKSQPKILAHPTGGVIENVATYEGAMVSAGDVLIEFESIQEKASLTILNAQITDAYAQAARLRAERDGAKTIIFPHKLVISAKKNITLANVLADQEAQFLAAKTALREKLLQFHEREKQFQHQITANKIRIKSYKAQLNFFQEDLDAQKSLLSNKLVRADDVNELRRQIINLGGQIAALHSDNARLKGHISEMKSAALEAKAAQKERVIASLQEIQARLLEYIEQRRKIQQALKKIEIVAPHDGIVQGLSVFAPGAVLGGGETALTLIPINDQLVIEGRIEPHQRDRIFINQSARVKFTAFNSKKTPEVLAKVSRISADRKIDPNNGAAWYAIELTLNDDIDVLQKKISYDQSNKLAPGIPADVFITTESRTVLTFLTKPFLDSIERIGRER
jgi:HlyD family secretion protein